MQTLLANIDNFFNRKYNVILNRLSRTAARARTPPFNNEYWPWPMAYDLWKIDSRKTGHYLTNSAWKTVPHIRNELKNICQTAYHRTPVEDDKKKIIFLYRFNSIKVHINS